jgi:hypothetical protein
MSITTTPHPTDLIDARRELLAVPVTDGGAMPPYCKIPRPLYERLVGWISVDSPHSLLKAQCGKDSPDVFVERYIREQIDGWLIEKISLAAKDNSYGIGYENRNCGVLTAPKIAAMVRSIEVRTGYTPEELVLRGHETVYLMGGSLSGNATLGDCTGAKVRFWEPYRFEINNALTGPVGCYTLQVCDSKGVVLGMLLNITS